MKKPTVIIVVVLLVILTIFVTKQNKKSLTENSPFGGYNYSNNQGDIDTTSDGIDKELLQAEAELEALATENDAPENEDENLGL